MVELTVEKILNGLKERLNTENKLLVQSPINGNCHLCKFTFNNPAEYEIIDDFSKKSGWQIPKDYMEFLLLHNGSELFIEEFEWGENSAVYFYSLQQIIKYNSSPISNEFYPIGLYVDSQILINNLRIKQNRNDYLFLLDDGNLIDFKCNFKTWLNRIILSQGLDYWNWKSKTVMSHNIPNE